MEEVRKIRSAIYDFPEVDIPSQVIRSTLQDLVTPENAQAFVDADFFFDLVSILETTLPQVKYYKNDKEKYGDARGPLLDLWIPAVTIMFDDVVVPLVGLQIDSVMEAAVLEMDGWIRVKRQYALYTVKCTWFDRKGEKS